MSKETGWVQKFPWLRLVGLILLGVLLWQLDIAKSVEIIQRANRFLVIAAIIFNLPMVWFKSLRWQTLMRSQDIQYPVNKAYLAYFGSIFIGFLTPGRVGEFVKALHLNQDCRISIGQALSSVLADRLFDLYALVLVGGLALFSLALNNTEIIVLAGFVLILTLPLVLLLNDSLFAWIQQLGLRLKLPGRKLFAPGSWLVEMRLGLRRLAWLWLVMAMVLTGLAYGLFFGQCYLLALALELPAGFVPISFAVALGSLVTLLPISISGLGTREAAIVAYLALVGIANESALAFSLLVFVTFYISGGLMGAIAWWIKPVPLAGVMARAGHISSPFLKGQ